MCEIPSTIPNGRVLNDVGKMKRNVIDFVCDMFYKPSTQKGTCLNDGTWTGLDGLCVATEMGTPLTVPVEGSITVGSVIRIEGTPTKPWSYIHVNFMDSANYHLLHISVRRNLKSVVRNSKLEEWGEEELGLDARFREHFPFQGNKTFTMTVFVETENYKCNVDGRKMFVYRHRIPLENVVNRVVLKGNVTFKSVAFSHQ